MRKKDENENERRRSETCMTNNVCYYNLFL